MFRSIRVRRLIKERKDSARRQVDGREVDRVSATSESRRASTVDVDFDIVDNKERIELASIDDLHDRAICGSRDSTHAVIARNGQAGAVERQSSSIVQLEALLVWDLRDDWIVGERARTNDCVIRDRNVRIDRRD